MIKSVGILFESGELVLVYYFISLIVILLDQLTKWLVVKYMELGESIPLITDFIYLTSHRNRGAAWGILQGQMWFFYIVTIIVIIGIIVFIQRLKDHEKLIGWSLGLMLGGAIGNFIDRVIHKEVVDFINTYVFTYDFPIFNVADSALVIGVGLFFIHTLLEGKQEKEKQHGTGNIQN
jgi:signal peptidase II